MNSPAIEVRGLTKRYGARAAVDGLSLTVEDGELFALLGLNGAGKTTTIKMLCGLTEPTDGAALVYGQSVQDGGAEERRMVNLSPQESAFAGKLTVRENLELMARVYGADRAAARDLASDLMSRLSLTDRAGDQARKLSGGLQRRLSIAMALITEPRLVFLDEPTLGLDIRARRELWNTLRELKGKMTIVLTTHYLEEAEALADRIGIMHDGALAALGTADELKALSRTDNIEDAFLALTGADEMEVER